MLEVLRLTPAFRRWNAGAATSYKDDLSSYQAALARVDQMLCHADILWPNFIELDTLILRESAIPDDWERFTNEAREANWTQSDVEYVLNHLHVADLFLNDPDRDEIDTAVYTFLANTIAEIWRCRLSLLYPDREFVVGVADQEIDPEVFAYCMRRENENRSLQGKLA